MKRHLIAMLLLVAVLLSGCTQKRYTADFNDVFDTYTTVIAYTSSKREFNRYVEIIHDEMARLHQLYDIYNDYEGVVNLKTVNDSAGSYPVQVSSDIMELLELAQQAHQDTDGAVNAALGPVLQVWHRYREQGIADPKNARLPSLEELEQAAAHTNLEDLVLDRENSTIFFRDPQMSLDVGALAKGYAAQKAADLARSAGLQSGIINAGGNVLVIGSPGDGRSEWSVGVQSPDGNELYDTVYYTNGAVVSSGNYQRYYYVNGERYHHIIDPQTLYPAHQVSAVTVIHPDSGIADMLSTAAYILPVDKSKLLVAQYGAEAIWILEDGSGVYTQGYQKISQKYNIEL